MPMTHISAQTRVSCHAYHYHCSFAAKQVLAQKKTHKSCILDCLFLVKMIWAPVGMCCLNILVLRSAAFS